MNEKLNLKPAVIASDRRIKQEDLDESDTYATPNCVSPEDSLQKTLSSSPSTELTKEYYALVPIEGQILDKELIEQDALSSAFKSFIHLGTEKFNDNKTTQCIKPTTLSLNSSHTSKIDKHSIICDISKDSDIDSNSFLFENDKNKINIATSQVRKHIKNSQHALKKSHSCETSAGAGEFSPDSLIADEPSSSSDYLSAAHSASPPEPNALPSPPECRNKMSNTLTITDSGFDNNAMLESHKDVTLADVSLTESTFHDLVNDESTVGDDSASIFLEKKPPLKPKSSNSQLLLTSAYKLPIVEMSGRSSKDEKQRQNEEIVILESSSLSSEAGSWESVFPPKMEKDICEKFINMERESCIDPAYKLRATEATNTSVAFQCMDIAQNTAYKATCCFIDAASLADEEDRQQAQIGQQAQVEPLPVNTYSIFRSSSRPVPCESKQVLSPNDFSESNDNDDSLEQPDPDSIQKDISPTIFEMNEDFADGENSYEDSKVSVHQPQLHTKLAAATSNVNNCVQPSSARNVMISTPNNSIISLKASDFKTYDSEGDAFLKRDTAIDTLKKQITPRPLSTQQDILFKDFDKQDRENSLIIASGIDACEPRHSYREFSNMESLYVTESGPSLMPGRKIGIPTKSGVHIPPEEDKLETIPKASFCASTWVVDMSKVSKLDTSATNRNNQKPGDRTCDNLRASSKSGSNSDGCKSRSSVDSDSSEKSTHKFYIDLSTLPDASTPEQNSVSEASIEKKNIFSMFIDLGENTSTVKEMPARLSSSLNTKKSSKMDVKQATPKTVKSNKKSPGVINGDDTFEKLESLCNSSQMSISEILQNPIAKKIVKEQREVDTSLIEDYHRPHPREGVAPTIREESDSEQYLDIFVRLSDLDRAPVQKNDTVGGAPNTECFERMTRSIPDNNWGETSHTNSRSTDIISSFHSENALSLNRLFPHLKNDISRSMPGSLSGRAEVSLRLGVSSSYGDREELVSDISEMSSVQSSMCRSVVGKNIDKLRI